MIVSDHDREDALKKLPDRIKKLFNNQAERNIEEFFQKEKKRIVEFLIKEAVNNADEAKRMRMLIPKFLNHATKNETCYHKQNPRILRFQKSV